MLITSIIVCNMIYWIMMFIMADTLERKLKRVKPKVFGIDFISKVLLSIVIFSIPVLNIFMIVLFLANAEFLYEEVERQSLESGQFKEREKNVN